jgi:hypothetical protein
MKLGGISLKIAESCCDDKVAAFYDDVDRAYPEAVEILAGVWVGELEGLMCRGHFSGVSHLEYHLAVNP